MVREREVSAAELVRAAIARAERVQPSLAAIFHASFEQAAPQPSVRARAPSPVCPCS